MAVCRPCSTTCFGGMQHSGLALALPPPQASHSAMGCSPLSAAVALLPNSAHLLGCLQRTAAVAWSPVIQGGQYNSYSFATAADIELLLWAVDPYRGTTAMERVTPGSVRRRWGRAACGQRAVTCPWPLPHHVEGRGSVPWCIGQGPVRVHSTWPALLGLLATARMWTTLSTPASPLSSLPLQRDHAPLLPGCSLAVLQHQHRRRADGEHGQAGGAGASLLVQSQLPVLLWCWQQRGLGYCCCDCSRRWVTGTCWGS